MSQLLTVSGVLLNVVSQSAMSLQMFSTLYKMFVCALLQSFEVGFSFITVLHAIQTLSSDEKSVRPSVRLSVKHVIADKM